jgi:hypothetical protein
MGKNYRLAARDFKPLATGLGGCVASDMVTVQGQRVGYMFRESPNNPGDSGWAFFSGTESEKFNGDPSNFAVFDVNSIANYDPEIVQFLGATVGSSFFRKPLDGPLRPQRVVPPPKPKRRGLTSDWSIEIEPTFQGRVDKGSLQLVDPGPPCRTIWVDVWGAPPTGHLDGIRARANPAALQRYDEVGADPKEHRFATWYPETVEGRRQHSLYAYTLRPEGCVQAAFIVDDPGELDWALKAWRSLRFRSAR